MWDIASITVIQNTRKFSDVAFQYSAFIAFRKKDANV